MTNSAGAVTSAPRWIANQADCDQAVVELEACDVIALDTEFVRRKTYFAELGLIQIASRKGVYLFDPTAAYNDAALGTLLKNPKILKVLHSVGEDLEVLRDRFGAPAGPFFDTQIAAALAGLGAMQSLAKLVQNLLGETVDKSETTSDWLKRPLTPGQIEYAATDVLVLLPMFDLLNAKLAELGRNDWVTEDCARVFAKAQANEADPQPHHKIKSTHFLVEESQRNFGGYCTGAKKRRAHAICRKAGCWTHKRHLRWRKGYGAMKIIFNANWMPKRRSPANAGQNYGRY